MNISEDVLIFRNQEVTEEQLLKIGKVLGLGFLAVNKNVS